MKEQLSGKCVCVAINTQMKYRRDRQRARELAVYERMMRRTAATKERSIDNDEQDTRRLSNSKAYPALIYFSLIYSTNNTYLFEITI